MNEEGKRRDGGPTGGQKSSTGDSSGLSTMKQLSGPLLCMALILWH